MARLLLEVNGGISAYKALETARLAIKAGHSVRVVQTEAGSRFIGPASFEAITGAPVMKDEFEPDPMRGAYPGDPPPRRTAISHLALVHNADLYLIAPASANTVAKLAHGHADNLLTTAALAASCPVLVAPAMNNHRYEHPATQGNRELLGAAGVPALDPGAAPGPGAAPRGMRVIAGRLGLGPQRAWSVARPAGTRDRRRNPRTDRQRAVHRQSLVGPDGIRARRAGVAPRRPGDGRGRQRRARATSRRDRDPGRVGGRAGGRM